MSDTYAHVSIKILGKEYQVACPAEEKAALLASAELLNEKMQDIRSSGKVLGLDRVAVMAALNMAKAARDFTYISTAGGAFLEWMEGKTLPGIAALGG